MEPVHRPETAAGTAGESAPWRGARIDVRALRFGVARTERCKAIRRRRPESMRFFAVALMDIGQGTVHDRHGSLVLKDEVWGVGLVYIF